MACLDEETVLLAALGQLDADGQAAVDEHLDACAACRRLLLWCARAELGPVRASMAATVADPHAGSVVDPDDLAPGATVDRYRVEARIGAGAMGVVYVAHDPDLDREVALKVLHARVEGDDGAARLLREGRAVARLAHSNVIGVHDVGVADQRGFIVMELVRGRSLHEWMEASPRRWDEVVGVLAQAGHGLAAAHAARLIHRDFKPANVLVGGDGRVKVGDFGLAREDGARAVADPRAAEAPPSTGAAAGSRTGALIGTPAYMAPEQLDGGRATAASDQFAFAVTLWEGVYGARPFVGASVATLRAAIAVGAPVGAGDAPVWLRAALVRALAEDPAARFPSMDALLAALVPPARSRGLWWAGLGAAVVVAAATAALVVGSAAASASPCVSAGLGAAWDASRRAAVERAFAAVRAPYAHDALVAVVRSLDAYARAWSNADRDRCEVAERAAAPPATRELDTACLAQLRREVDGLTALLATADEDLVRRAPLAVGALTAPATCRDASVLGRRRPPGDLATRVRVDAASSMLADARALAIAGRYGQAAVAGERVLAQARLIGYAPLIAEAALLTGRARVQNGDAVAGEHLLVDAARAAEASRDDDTAAAARIERVAAVGLGQHDFARAVELAGDAQAALDRLGGAPTPLARLLDYRGSVALLAGRPAEAVALHTQALALRRAVLPAEDDDITTSLVNLGGSLDVAGRFAEARAMFDDALARRERALGRDHPAVADILSSRGIVFAEGGEFAASDADWQRALAIREAALPPDHPSIAAVLSNLGANARDQRRFDLALALYRRAWTILDRRGLHVDAALRQYDIALVFRLEHHCDEAAATLAPALTEVEAALGADHPTVAHLLALSAEIDTCRKRFPEALAALARVRAIDEARFGPDHARVASDFELIAEVYLHANADARAIESFREALRRKERALGPDHLDLSTTLVNMSDSLRALHRCGEAVPLLARAIAIEERGWGATSAHLAYPLHTLAQCRDDLGDPADAVAAGERALALDGFDQLGELAAQVRMDLGELLWRRGERARGRALIAAALPDLRGVDPPVFDEVTAWLAQHPAPPPPAGSGRAAP